MAKGITSTDWHLRGVSVEMRKLVNAYCEMTDLQQGEAVEFLLLQSPPLKALAVVFKSSKTTK
jgi:hypothetical protein